jgi:diguanylate cyclase
MANHASVIRDKAKRAGIAMLRQREAREWLAGYRGNDQRPLALLIIGIRDLKQINERFGRADGDTLIRKVGNSIRHYAAIQISNVEMVARLPGREFLIAVGGSSEVENHAEGLIKTLAGNFGAIDQPLHISARIGVAFAGPKESGPELLHRASGALARAYDRKGKKFIVAELEQAATQQFNAALDTNLRAAIQNRKITIMLQPQFSVNNGGLVGAEALARWHHPTLGEIGANSLFAAADRCDLREELSHAIQQQAISIASSWPAGLDNLRLSVNLGAEELTDDYTERLFLTGASDPRTY